MKLIAYALAGSVLATISGTTLADAAAGKTKSSVCAACHGVNGISSNPVWPNLAGQQGAYIIKQLKAFQSGERNDPMMSPQAKQLSPEDMQDLADYYSSLK